MGSTSEIIAGIGLLALALWWYTQYRTSHPSFSSEDMWRSSQVLSLIAIIMMIFIYILVQVSR